MWAAILAMIAKIVDKLPIQGRRERWRNEVQNLEKEKATLLKGKANAKKAARVIIIERRINYLNQLLRNAEKD